LGSQPSLKTAEQNPYVGVAAVVFSIIVPVLSGITTFLNPNEKEGVHLAAAHAYDRLNNAARMFWSIDCWAADATDEASFQVDRPRPTPVETFG
jgi:hypothetical protein